MSRSSSVKRICLIFASLVMGFTAVASGAQTNTPESGRRVPTGSPLSGDRSSGAEEDERSPPTYDPTRMSSPIEPARIVDTDSEMLNPGRFQREDRGLLEGNARRLREPPKPGEFEDYVTRILGRPLPRFGSDLLLPSNRDFATPATATVPPGYVLNVGDVVSISLTGSMEGSVDREIDTDGRIFLPKVGSIMLAGVRYNDLRDRVSAAVGRQYRGYTVSVGIRRLRGIRVYVTGFANNPGAFTVSSLSTMANAVFSAGGPSSGGSFRSVKLYRGGAEVADFDLYELVRGGNRVNDAVLQNEDVLFIPAAGPQVAVVGSVNAEAIYEAKPGESLEDLLRYAGGPNSLGDPSRIILYRTADPNVIGPQNVAREAAGSQAVLGGDILQLLSKGTLVQPVEQQSVLVRIEGEVNRPGNYFVAPNTPLSVVLDQAGGLTQRAFAFGTKLQRVSVRAQQRESYQEAIKQLEMTLAAAPLTSDTIVDAGERDKQITSARAVLNQLREAEPDGRVVLDLPASATTLPGEILLENNDQILVPPRVDTVGVFGAVYRPASFLLSREQPPRVRDFIDRAGGALRSADTGGIFVVRANGEVLPKRRGALSARVLPGDVIFVPVRTQGGTFWSRLRDISTILFQFGISAATLGALTE